MKTLLPYPNFACSAYVLDDRRLERQCADALTILGLLRDGHRTRDHPVVHMWSRNSPALGLYLSVAIRETQRRGIPCTMVVPFEADGSRGIAHHAREMMPEHAREIVMPSWLGREDMHASHRANLLRLDPEWYGRWGWTEQPADTYVWPEEATGCE